MTTQVIDTEQNLASQLVHSNVKVESIAKRRHTRRIIPINGARLSNEGYVENEEIEFTVSSKDLLDCQTLTLSVQNAEVIGGGLNGGFDGSIASTFEDIEVYYGDKLIERLSSANVLYNAMTYASSNDGYLTNEGTQAGWGLNIDTDANLMSIKGKAHKRKSGDYIVSLDVTGLSEIKTFLPVYTHNLRIKIRLASNAKALDMNTAGGNTLKKKYRYCVILLKYLKNI